jgi:hypothetical protein
VYPSYKEKNWKGCKKVVRERRKEWRNLLPTLPFSRHLRTYGLLIPSLLSALLKKKKKKKIRYDVYKKKR